MKREELKKAIENGESVWLIGKDSEGNKRARTKKLNNKYDEVLNNKLNGFWTLNKIFKTKAAAEHYLHHANITRTETLPFLTWEEFLIVNTICFTDKENIDYELYFEEGKLYLRTGVVDIKTWDLTETNFYKAYDECVELFRGKAND